MTTVAAGAQTERRGLAGPVRASLGGTTSPAAFFPVAQLATGVSSGFPDRVNCPPFSHAVHSPRPPTPAWGSAWPGRRGPAGRGIWGARRGPAATPPPTAAATRLGHRLAPGRRRGPPESAVPPPP